MKILVADSDCLGPHHAPILSVQQKAVVVYSFNLLAQKDFLNFVSPLNTVPEAYTAKYPALK